MCVEEIQHGIFIIRVMYGRGNVLCVANVSSVKCACKENEVESEKASTWKLGHGGQVLQLEPGQIVPPQIRCTGGTGTKVLLVWCKKKSASEAR